MYKSLLHKDSIMAFSFFKSLLLLLEKKSLNIKISLIYEIYFEQFENNKLFIEKNLISYIIYFQCRVFLEF